MNLPHLMIFLKNIIKCIKDRVPKIFDSIYVALVKLYKTPSLAQYSRIPGNVTQKISLHFCCASACATRFIPRQCSIHDILGLNRLNFGHFRPKIVLKFWREIFCDFYRSLLQFSRKIGNSLKLPKSHFPEIPKLAKPQSLVNLVNDMTTKLYTPL